MRGLPFYVKREAFARADTRQRVAYILSAVLVITMLCVIFRFSAADATHSSHLSEGVCIRLVRELNSVFSEQFPKEKLVKVAEAIEYPIRKCAHFTEYAVLGITVNLYLWMCYRTVSYTHLRGDTRMPTRQAEDFPGGRIVRQLYIVT